MWSGQNLDPKGDGGLADAIDLTASKVHPNCPGLSVASCQAGGSAFAGSDSTGFPHTLPAVHSGAYTSQGLIIKPDARYCTYCAYITYLPFGSPWELARARDSSILPGALSSVNI